MKKVLHILLIVVMLTCLFNQVGCEDDSNDADCSIGLSYELNENQTKYILTGIGECNDINIVIPSKHNGKRVIAIAKNAFVNNDNITSVKIPDTVTSIKDGAFRDCSSLTSIEIPSDLTYIGAYAFAGCPIEKASIPTFAISHIQKNALKEVVLTGGPNIISDSFEDCALLTNVTIEDDVFILGSRAFKDCSSLSSVTIKNSGISIGISAFENCTSLTSIKYGGSEEQWKALDKGIYWNKGIGNYTIIYNYTGE